MSKKNSKMVACRRCGFRLPELQSLLPSIFRMTEKGTVDLKSVNSDQHVHCPRCARYYESQRLGSFSPFNDRKREIARMIRGREIDKEMTRAIAAVAGQAQIASIAVPRRPVEQVKTNDFYADRNGNPLQGIVKRRRFQKALEGATSISSAVERAAEEKEARREFRRTRQSEKRKRNEWRRSLMHLAS